MHPGRVLQVRGNSTHGIIYDESEFEDNGVAPHTGRIPPLNELVSFKQMHGPL